MAFAVETSEVDLGIFGLLLLMRGLSGVRTGGWNETGFWDSVTSSIDSEWQMGQW